MKYLLDSDICITFFQGKFKMPEKIDSIGIENCYVSEISIYELTYGAINSSQVDKHRNEVVLLEELFTIVPALTATEIYAVEKVRLRRIGSLIPDFDLLIGASAVANDMVMVTNNVKHLGRIEGITIENLRKPEHNEFLQS